MPAFAGQNTDIDTAAEALGSSQAVAYATVVKAPVTNTGIVYVGFADTVTTSTGYGLWPGESVTIPVGAANNVAGIYVIASANNQTAHYLGL